MTREGQGDAPREAPPPTSTRWTEPATPEDAGLLPPFMPGKRRPAEADEPMVAGPDAVEALEPVQGAEEAVEETAEAAAETGEAVVHAESEDEPFPFELPETEALQWDAEEEGYVPAEEEPVPVAEWEEPETVEAPGTEPEGEPWGDGAVEEVTEEWAEGRVEEAALEPPPWEALEEVQREQESLGGAMAEEAAEAEAAPAEPDEPPRTIGPAEAEMAERLETLAARIRVEGAAAAEAEMDSSDRLMSLVAGLIAGYLAGLET
jgi:hypothetical protein